MIEENNKLVQRIEGIHFRSPKFPMATKATKDETMHVRRGSSFSQKRNSLNIINRRAEEERILRENMIMFEKLAQSKSHVRKSDHDKDFEQHKKY